MKYQNSDSAHLFAFYIPSIYAKIKTSKTLTIEDSILFHRVVRVLRLQSRDSVILFDHDMHVFAEIDSVSNNKFLNFMIISQHQNKEFKPYLTLFLPMLKKEALEDALYAAVEIGVQEIRLFFSQKSQQMFRTDYEKRLHTIMIAAAEQSKNFKGTCIKNPISFDQVIKMIKSPSILADPKGQAMVPIIDELCKKKPQHIQLIIGPEGDLTQPEKEQLRVQAVQFCSLTPTILRAQQAAAILCGSIRSSVRY